MTAPTDTEPEKESRPPENAEWVNVNDLPQPPPAEPRSEPAAEKKSDTPGRPLGHIAAIGGSGAVLGGAGLFAAFGPVGLAAGACAAVGGAGLYGYHRYRKNQGPRGSRGPRTRRDRSRRTGSRLGSAGLGRKGKGPKLFGGGRGKGLGGKSGGPKLGKGGKSGLLGGKGGKLGSGKGGPKLGGGKGPKLGKGGGPKLGGKSGRLLGGKSGKLGAGGRGKGLGGKLGNGRKAAASKLGSARKGGGRLLGRGGKAAGMKLGRAGRTAGRKAGALRTKAGRRTANGFKAAAKALRSSGTNGRWSRFHQARMAARAKLGGKNWFTRFLAAAGAAAVASVAMGRIKWTARKDTKPGDKRAETPAGTDTPLGDKTPTGTVITGTVISSAYETSPTGRPAGSALTSITRSSMSEFPLEVAARQVAAAAAAYKPRTMWVVDQDLEVAHRVPLAIAEAFKIYTMTLRNNYPLHSAITEALGRAYIALGEVSVAMQQVPGLFKQVHADDIRRRTAPRGDESKWNV